jgi:multidrug resistance efflux pump
MESEGTTDLEVHTLEEDVQAAERRLEELERRVKTMAVEARAAQDPTQFQHGTLGRRRELDVAPVLGGVMLGLSAAFVVARLLTLVGG